MSHDSYLHLEKKSSPFGRLATEESESFQETVLQFLDIDDQRVHLALLEPIEFVCESHGAVRSTDHEACVRFEGFVPAPGTPPSIARGSPRCAITSRRFVKNYWPAATPAGLPRPVRTPNTGPPVGGRSCAS